MGGDVIRRRALRARRVAVHFIVAWGVAIGATAVTAQDATLPRPPAPAAPASEKDANTPAVTLATETHITVRADRTSLQRHSVRMTIGQESALRSVGQQSINFVEGMETLELVEAFTEKADGRKIPVDPTTVLTRDAASGLNAVYLRDAKTRTVIFPDIAVGDTLVFTTLKDIKQTAHAGQFAYSWIYQRASPWLTATHVIEAPASVALRLKVSGEGMTHTTQTEGDTVRHRIAYAPSAKRPLEESGAVAAADREPQFALSTFQTYEELGRSYWASASPMVTVTPEIQALASEIVRGLEGRRAEADAIDRWLKRNVRYVAVYLGRQRWVPHSAGTVLANKYGDCKDLTTLMSALLKARGIAAEHVLINLGNSYVLPELPPGGFNHAIVYIPEFDVYTDPTATYSAFGMLSTQTYDKPVLLASETGSRLARTPAMRPDDHVTTARTTAKVAADGTISGETAQSATGIFAASSRSAYLNFQGLGFERSAETRLKAIGTPGKGRFDATSPSELREPYLVRATFTLDDKFAVPLRGARRLPIGLPVHVRPGLFLLGARVPERHQPFTCFSGRQIEDIEVEFAAGLPMPRRPNPRTIETKAFVYKASYEVDGRVFKARREFTSRVSGQVCPPEMEKELAEQLKPVFASLGSPLVFGPGAESLPGDYAPVATVSEPAPAKSAAAKATRKAPATEARSSSQP